MVGAPIFPSQAMRRACRLIVRINLIENQAQFRGDVVLAPAGCNRQKLTVTREGGQIKPTREPDEMIGY